MEVVVLLLLIVVEMEEELPDTGKKDFTQILHKARRYRLGDCLGDLECAHHRFGHDWSFA